MLFNYKNISLHILSQVTKLMQRTHFKIYLWLFCICRKVNHKTKLKTFLRAGWHNWLFSHKALSIYYIYGERERNALGFKRNIRILSFLSETRDRQRETCLWEQFDLRTSQKFCRSSWERMEKAHGKKFQAQNCCFFSFWGWWKTHLIKSAGAVPTCLNTNTLDTYREQSGNHFGYKFAGNRFCSPEGFRRHESTSRWPGPPQARHLSEEAVWTRLPSSYRCALPPCSSKARRSRWGLGYQLRPSRGLEVLLKWWGVLTDPQCHQ